MTLIDDVQAGLVETREEGGMQGRLEALAQVVLAVAMIHLGQQLLARARRSLAG